MVWLRSLLFQIYFFASVSVAALSIFLCWFLPFNWRFAVAKAWGQSMLFVGKHLCGLDYVIEGRENIPDVPSIIMIKHTTVFETYAQLAIFPPQTWVLKRELRWIPFFGWGLAAMNPIAIDRGAGLHAVQQVVEQGKERLANGIWITIFPEGTRMPLGETKRYGISGALLAREAQVPVLPVAHNAGEYWPRRSFIKRPGVIQVRIGAPISPQGKSAQEILDEASGWIEDRMAEITTLK